MKKIVLIGILLGFVGCLDENQAKRALDTNGFTNVTITDSGVTFPQLSGCGEKEIWYEASATNSLGKQVNVVVCCGQTPFLKGCTVRSR